jgi:hypothetical protein
MAILSYAQSISELAQAGAAKAKELGILGSCGKMCDTCAFRWNQPHVLTYFLAADNAADKLINGGDFNCHTWDFKESEHECVGFKLAKLVYEPDES